MIAFHSVERRRAVVLGALALLALALVLRHTLAHGGSGGTPSLAVAPVVGGSPVASPAAVTAPLVVDVVGAVRRPGVYRLPAGSRVEVAVARAGGLTRRADLTAVNLAAPLADGQQVVVAARAAPGGSGSSAAGGPVSLSSATAEQLDALPGIGPVTAQKIVDYRTQHGAFTSVDALDAIAGIGPARIQALQGLVVP